MRTEKNISNISKTAGSWSSRSSQRSEHRRLHVVRGPLEIFDLFVLINGKDGGCDESDHGIPSSFVSVLFCRVSQAFELIFRSPGIVYLILLFKSSSDQSVVHRIVAHTGLRPSPYASETL